MLTVSLSPQIRRVSHWHCALYTLTYLLTAECTISVSAHRRLCYTLIAARSVVVRSTQIVVIVDEKATLIRTCVHLQSIVGDWNDLSASDKAELARSATNWSASVGRAVTWRDLRVILPSARWPQSVAHCGPNCSGCDHHAWQHGSTTDIEHRAYITQPTIQVTNNFSYTATTNTTIIDVWYVEWIALEN